MEKPSQAWEHFSLAGIYGDQVGGGVTWRGFLLCLEPGNWPWEEAQLRLTAESQATGAPVGSEPPEGSASVACLVHGDCIQAEYSRMRKQ